MERIASFCVDHTKLQPGMYLSRQDGANGEILTWDIRMKQPNKGSYLSPAAVHTLEHLFATYARNSKYSSGVVYVGPMGCLTGFYLLTTGLTPAEALDLTQEEVAERLAKSRPSIANTLRLLNLPEEIQQYLKDGKLQSGHAKVILSLPEKPMQFRLADRIAEGGVSVREAERLAKAMLQPGREKKKPEQPADTDLKFAEDRLRDRLGTKVSIQGSQSKGKVIIEYYSRDELNGIYDILIRE